jgi:hypothetical protein
MNVLRLKTIRGWGEVLRQLEHVFHSTREQSLVSLSTIQPTNFLEILKMLCRWSFQWCNKELQLINIQDLSQLLLNINFYSFNYLDRNYHWMFHRKLWFEGERYKDDETFQFLSRKCYHRWSTSIDSRCRDHLIQSMELVSSGILSYWLHASVYIQFKIHEIILYCIINCWLFHDA